MLLFLSNHFIDLVVAILKEYLKLYHHLFFTTRIIIVTHHLLHLPGAHSKKVFVRAVLEM